MKRLLAKIVLWAGMLLMMLLGPAPSVQSVNLEVVSPADSGAGTLRQALLDAAAGDTITFSPSVFPPDSPVTIFVQSALPTLTQDNVTIDASNAGVILDGSGITTTDTNGIRISGANWVIIKGLQILHFPDDGIEILGGAQNVIIGGDRNTGNGLLGEGNLISGNGHMGILIVGEDTSDNTVIGNFIGTNADGNASLGNVWDGIKIDGLAHDNRVEENVLSGNGSNGIIICGGAHHNVVCGNFIGTDKTGTFAIGGQPGGGVDLASGAHHNTIGGPTAAERNVISGNGVDGIFIEGWDTQSNTIQGNYIGTDVSGTAAVPNNLWGLFILNGAPDNLITYNLISRNISHGLEVTYSATGSEIISNTISHNGGAGIHFTEGVSLHQVMSNTITGNSQAGVLVEDGCTRNRLTGNSIHDNGGQGIQLNGTANAALPAPELTVVATDTITGTTVPNAQIELFSDDDDEGRVYEGFAVANAGGDFSFTQPGGFAGPNVTATSTDTDGNTSEFSQPAHLLWTLLLYLNGDNDLEEFMFDTMTNTVAAGPSPRANVLALVDGYTTTTAYSGTVLYDITRGQATPLNPTWIITGERDMGDRGTLVDFVAWGRAHYPARHTMLAIVDHGGGWAPSSEALPTAGSALRDHGWSAGNSGLSWDFSSDYDYLDSPEIRQAMAAITGDGANPLDVVFYDVCLMGMLEVAYDIKDYASFFVSSQNIGWAPLGPQGRYIQTIQGIEPTATPRQVAELLVQAYANATPPNGHPFTISAVDMTSLLTVANAVNQLAVAISQTLTGPDQAAILHTAYSEAQKIDYDSDFYIEPDTDGFADLYDFSLRTSQQFTDPAVDAAAQNVMTALDAAIVTEQHRSGSPWMAPDRVWDLDNVHGLSIFLPLGQDLELPILITETLTITPSLVITRNLRLRDMYTSEQLQFVEDTAWDGLITTYYQVIASPVPTDTTQGPVDGLQIPDVTPPQTVITVTGTLAVGEAITATWVSMDTQTGVNSTTLWHQTPSAKWTAVVTQSGSSGAFPFTLSEAGINSFAVRGTDGAGNVEPLDNGPNTIVLNIPAPIYLPLIFKHYP